MIHNPSWFQDKKTLIVNARTCGINKDGKEQYIVDPETGIRSDDDIDDSLAECCEAISQRDFSREEVFYHKTAEILNRDAYVPKYFDDRVNRDISQLICANADKFSRATLGELKNIGDIIIRNGHGTPSSDQRTGEIPYIKVSDLRAGHVNINPTNMVPLALAQNLWGGNSSGFKKYDLISPERASKNIGEFCILMPGQENSVFTREVIVVRSNSELFDQFYLLWALTLKEVVCQWERIVFMQTNREDVGGRINEIVIPIPKNRGIGNEVSKDFRDYYTNIENARQNFTKALRASSFSHYIHLDA